MITVARVSRLFGVDGELIINLHTTFPDDFNLESPMFVKINSLLVPLYCDKFERRGRANAQVRFADFDTDRRAMELVGAELLAPESEEAFDPNDEEFFMEDLIGFAVVIDGVQGELTGYIESAHNPLFEIELEGKEHLIPAAEEFIAAIDFDARRIVFILPEGLLDL
ncbi:MAG: ribosome maturation factor RimM [Rikenellaceae bacterium]